MIGVPQNSSWSNTSQIGCTSRYRMYSTDSSTAIAVANTTTQSTAKRKSSQVALGVTPSIRAKASTTATPSARLAAAVSDTEIGTDARGNETFLRRFSRATRLPRPPLVASEKKLKTTIAASSTTG